MTRPENLDDLYSIFDKVDPVYDMSNLREGETFKRILATADVSSSKLVAPRTSSIQLGSSIGYQRQATGFRHGLATPKTGNRMGSAFRLDTAARMATGIRPGTNAAQDGVNRPMTAVRAAGFTSQPKEMFDPLNQSMQKVSSSDSLKEETTEEKIKVFENRIMQLIEESCMLSSEGKHALSLDKAKEASAKERNLIRLQEQSNLSDTHNLDVTFSVLFNLSNQYALNEQYSEALNTYDLLTKNRMFTQANRLKVNMGNIFYKQGHYHKAIKMYRMALDQVPSNQKNLRIKIMHNISVGFVKMGLYEDAISSLEYIMSEKADFRSGLDLVLCYYALEDKEKMKRAFLLMLNVPLDVDDEDKYKITTDDLDELRIVEAIRNDDLHSYEKKMISEAQHCILTAAKIISPIIESSFHLGYDWCIEQIKHSNFSRLAGDLEINKAVMYLKQRQTTEAIDTLKSFDKDSKMAAMAAVNLSFIYFLQGDLENAEKYGESVKQMDGYNAGGFINLGCISLAKHDLNQAKEYFLCALSCDGASVEAQYNLGLVLKRQGMYSEALECFQKFDGSLALLPEVLFHQAALLELLGDSEASVECYQQLLGILPTDPGVLQRLALMLDHEGDKQQAFHYHFDAYRYYPSNLSVIDWMGSYYIELQVVEKAQLYFETATTLQPLEPKWRLMVAGCHRRSGNLHRALALYQDIHKMFPENVECLRFLVRLCNDLGLREASEYTLELKKLERTREVRDRVGSGRPGSRRSSSGLSSRGGSGFSQGYEGASSSFSARSQALRSRNKLSQLLALHDRSGSSDSGFGGQNNVDASYSDPLGPLAGRPRTAAGKPLEEDFGDELLGDDLLPQ